MLTARGITWLLLVCAACLHMPWSVSGQFQHFEVPQYTNQTVTLTNSKGMSMTILPLGAIVQRLVVPDKNGNPVDVALGMDTAQQYLELNPLPYLGAVLGRVSNRIVGANFTLDGVTYNTSVNDALPVPGSKSTNAVVNDTIHGGVTGFTMRMWDLRKMVNLDGQTALLHLTSPDGDQGFPGTVNAWVTYKLLDQMNRVEVTFLATTDKATPISLTTHAYFNLNGHNSSQLITNHIVTIPSDYYTPDFNNTIVPTGQVASVNGTAFDLRRPTQIGSIIDKVPTSDVPPGYDINYITQVGYPAANITDAVPKPVLIASVVSPLTGIKLDAYSNAPGFEWYTGNHLPGPGEPVIHGKDNATYVRRDGFAIEPQGWPMALKYPNFPSIIVRPGEIYAQQLVWDFSTVGGTSGSGNTSSTANTSGTGSTNATANISGTGSTNATANSSSTSSGSNPAISQESAPAGK